MTKNTLIVTHCGQNLPPPPSENINNKIKRTTEYILKTVREAEPNTRWLVATELNLVNRLVLGKQTIEPAYYLKQFWQILRLPALH
jgi:hypothetical protein